MAWTEWDKSAAELAELILGEREQHLVVVSHLPSGGLNLDAAWIAEETEGFADVVVIANGTFTYDLADRLPYGWNVFGNAARAYRADGRGTTPYVRPLNRGELKAKARRLADLVQALPLPDRLREQTLTGPLPVVQAPAVLAGTVRGFVGGGELAWIDFPDGGSGIVRQEDVVPGVRLDWLLQPGQEISGKFDPASNVFDISASVSPIRSAPAYYSWNQVVLGLVESAGADSATLVLLPGDRCEVRREDVSSNPLDNVDEMLTEGMVVPVRLTQSSGVRRLSLHDVDDDEPVADAPALVEGGLPWLQLGRNLLPPSVEELQQGAPKPSPDVATTAADAAASAEAAGPAASVALRSVQLQLDTARSEIRKLRAELAEKASDAGLLARREEDLDRAQADLAAAARELDMLRTDLRRQKELRMKAQERLRKVENSRHRAEQAAGAKFATDEEAFRHELYLAWVDRVEPREKGEYRLARFVIGDKFLASFREHSADQRQKALRALVDLLTNRAERMPAREIHPLRLGPGAEEPQRYRDSDGAGYWRMSVEGNTPASRRIHFLRLPGGGLELHELVPHEKTVP